MNRRTVAFAAAFIILICAFGCRKKNSDEKEKLTLLPETSSGTLAAQEATATAPSGTAAVSDGEAANATAVTGAQASGMTTLIYKPPFSVGSTAARITTTRPLPTTRAITTILRTTNINQTYITRHTSTARSTRVTTTFNRTTVPPTTAKPLKISVQLGGIYTQTVTKTVTEAGKTFDAVVTNKCKLVSAKAEKNQQGTATLTLGMQVVENSPYGTSMTVSYDCYDAQGAKLNKTPLMLFVSNGGDAGKINIAIATAPLSTAKVVLSNFASTAG